MAEREEFLRQILEDPFDDTVRLAYADWLMERPDYDDRERGLVVRGQVLATIPPSYSDRLVSGDALGWSHYYDRGRYGYDCFADWYGEDSPYRVRPEARFVSTPGADWTPAVVWRRGFVDEVRLSRADLTAESTRELFASHPVTRVSLCRCRPYRGRQKFHWFRSVSLQYGTDPRGSYDRSHWVSDVLEFPGTDGLGRRIVHYASAASAYAALSWTLVNHGRRVCGLPILPDTEEVVSLCMPTVLPS